MQLLDGSQANHLPLLRPMLLQDHLDIPVQAAGHFSDRSLVAFIKDAPTMHLTDIGAREQLPYDDVPGVHVKKVILGFLMSSVPGLSGS
jgi:hypothetical protein